MATIRTFHKDDADKIADIAIAAFGQFSQDYDNWPLLQKGLRSIDQLANNGTVMLAEHQGDIVGAVAYMPPSSERAAYFDPSWPIIRMLVVSPKARGLGIGRALTEACIANAIRDNCKEIALHTSPIMAVALAMYQRMGFQFQYKSPAIYGVPYGVYLKILPQIP